MRVESDVAFETELRALMLAKHAMAFTDAIMILTDIKWSLKANELPSEDERKNINRTLDRLSEYLTNCQMLRPLAEIDRLRDVLDGKNGMDRLDGEVIAQHIKMLTLRIVDELSYEQFLHLDPTDAELYGKALPFGEAVEKKFPEASEDIEEAGKCLAAGQPTASVFHLMRAM